MVPVQKLVFKKEALFLSVFQSRNLDKAGLCWKEEEVRVKLNTGVIILGTVGCHCEHLSSKGQI